MLDYTSEICTCGECKRAGDYRPSIWMHEGDNDSHIKDWKHRQSASFSFSFTGGVLNQIISINKNMDAIRASADRIAGYQKIAAAGLRPARAKKTLRQQFSRIFAI